MRNNSTSIALAALGLICSGAFRAGATLTEYQSAVLATPNLISYYEFDGSTAIDSKGTNHGAAGGTASFSPGVGGGADQSLHLDGSGWLDFNSVPAFDFVSGTGTVELWLQAGWADGPETWVSHTLVGNYQGATYPNFNYTISMSEGKSALIYWRGGVWDTIAIPSPGTNWHHLAVVFKANSWTLVWDGLSLATHSTGVWPGLSGGQTQLGSDMPSGAGWLSVPWIGNLDEVALYNTNLPLSRIQAHYAAYAILSSNVAPVIVRQPQGSNYWYVGHLGTLTITVNAVQPHYQWYKNSGLIAGATNSFLSLASVTLTDAGTYTCVVTNLGGSVTSSPPAVVMVSLATPTPLAAYQASVRAEPSLISYYAFDGLTARDDFGNNNGETQGTASFATGVGGGSDQALNLDGVSWDNLGGVPALDFASGKGTVELWLKCGWTNDLGGAYVTPTVFSNFGGGAANYVVMMYGDRSRIILWNGTVWQTVALPADPGTGWHRLAVVFNAGTWTLIWDGVSLATTTCSWPGVSGNPTQLGAVVPSGVDWGNYVNWIGELDEVAFYSDALSPVGIQAHYAAAYAATNAVPWNTGVVVSRLQTPQVLDGPNSRSDTPSRAFWNGSELSMYVANAYTYNLRGTDMRSGAEAWDFYADASTSLAPGSPGNFDDGGAWLLHAEVAPENTNLVRGWYHAEQTRSGAYARKTMAYCESTDGGRTFQKVCAEDGAKNYPNNQFITAWTGFSGDPTRDGTGDARIVKVGGYYYCYFLATDDWHTHVARSAVLDHGRPGTWWKYYDPAGADGANGTWTEPGLGGRSSSPFSLSDIYAREMTWNADMNQFMIDTDTYPSLGFCGISLAFSTNNVFGWQRAPYPLFPVEGVWSNAPSWNRDISPAKALIAYRGFAALDGATDGQYPPMGSTRFGTSFWFETAFLNPKEGFAERYLLRQKVNLSVTASGALPDQVGRIELGLFRHRDNSDDWATTYNTLGHYRKVQTLGYLCTANIAGTTPLYDLTNLAGKHLASLNPTEATELSLLGYLFTNQVSGALPLYRTSLADIYSATTNASAPGVTALLGYLFPPVGDETFAYRYDATEQTEVINGGAELVPFTRTGQQGYHNWYFAERSPSGALVPLTYSPASAPSWYPIPTQVWTSTSGANGAKLSAYGGTPGTTNRAVREWVAIDTGIVYISARAFSLVTAGGDNGVNVLIQKNGKVLWQSPVTNGRSSAQSVSFGKWLAVTLGDSLTFEIAPLATTSVSANTYFHPTIWFEWGTLLSSNLVSVLNLPSNTVSIQWPSSANQTYIVESSGNQLTGAWTPVSPPILATTPTNTFVLTRTNSSAYYRLRLVE